MNALDIVILAVISIAGIMGFMRGLIAQFGQVAALIVAVIACRIFAPTVDTWLHTYVENPAYATAAAYGMVFFAAYLTTWGIAFLLRKLVHAVSLGIVDRLAGAAFKIMLWVTLLSLALNIAQPFFTNFEFRSAEYPWRAIVMDVAPAVLGFLNIQL